MMKKKIDWDKPKKGLLNSINAIFQTITYSRTCAHIQHVVAMWHHMDTQDNLGPWSKSGALEVAAVADDQ